MIKSLFLKIILIIAVIGGFNKTSASAKSFGEFAKEAVTVGVRTGSIAVLLSIIPLIRNKIQFGGFFAKRPGKIRFDLDTTLQILVGFPAGIISLSSFGIAAISKFGQYGIANQLFSVAQFFGGLSGVSAVGAMLFAKMWYQYENNPLVKDLQNLKENIKKREEPTSIALSKERTVILKDEAYKLESKIAWEVPEYKRLISSKNRFIISSLASVIFAIAAIKAK